MTIINTLANTGFSIISHEKYGQTCKYNISRGIYCGTILEESANSSYLIEIDGYSPEIFSNISEVENFLSMVAEETAQVDVTAMANRMPLNAKKLLGAVAKDGGHRYSANELRTIGNNIGLTGDKLKDAAFTLYKREFIYVTKEDDKTVYNFDRTKLSSLK